LETRVEARVLATLGDRFDRQLRKTHRRIALKRSVEAGIVVVMGDFEGPTDLSFNRGLIADPEAFARESQAASWLFLCGEEFATMEGGMAYASVQAAVPESANIVSDPPQMLDMDLARRQVDALDHLPRPTLVTCRTVPRSSALVNVPLCRAGGERGA
jgi:hypothetical protein